MPADAVMPLGGKGCASPPRRSPSKDRGQPAAAPVSCIDRRVARISAGELATNDGGARARTTSAATLEDDSISRAATVGSSVGRYLE
jgi:hypothetical protein